VSHLTGYSNRISVAPGERVEFMISCDSGSYDAAVVRLVHGDDSPAGPGYREDVVVPDLAVGQAAQAQVARPGSCVHVEGAAALQRFVSFTLLAWIWPTTPAAGRDQFVMGSWGPPGSDSYALVINAEGNLELRTRKGSERRDLPCGTPLRKREWYFVAASCDTERGTLHLHQHPRSPWAQGWVGSGSGIASEDGLASRCPFVLAAAWDGGPRAAYNGKLDRPAVVGRALAPAELERLRTGLEADRLDCTRAAWDLGDSPAGTRILDRGPNGLHGRTVNRPTRAVTGHNWSGRESDFRLAPDEYGAIHFHADDVDDLGWTSELDWQVPAESGSGFYALRVTAEGQTDRIPFFVRPARTAAGRHPRIVVIAPTMTYLAYANLPLRPSVQPNRPPDWDPPSEPVDELIDRHPEYGYSLYQVHEDASGCTYSSWLRPIPTLRPTYRASFIDAARHLAGDLYLVDWLESKDFEFDVITDHDLHADGLDLLNRYRVVVTGSHPEYASREMLEALEAYVDGGGRLMYLGGNGFYWVTSVDPAHPEVIEVRRGFAGSRPWESAPGELHHSTTGELGGLWRYRGELPNRIVGVAFATEGVGQSSGYARLPDSHHADARFIFEGVERDEIIGDFGMVMDSAVGDELDRADVDLGTPPEARLLATSTSLGEYYRPCLEDDLSWRADRRTGEARADMVYLENPRGGAVFSVGSIAWSASLSHNDYDNNVSRITENVVRRFADL
jgi:N,N-dimethylformamidase